MSHDMNVEKKKLSTFYRNKTELSFYLYLEKCLLSKLMITYSC